jgi:hypothetical protein
MSDDCTRLTWHLCRISETDESTSLLHRDRFGIRRNYRKYYKVIADVFGIWITFSRYKSPYWVPTWWSQNTPMCNNKFEGIVDMK